VTAERTFRNLLQHPGEPDRALLEHLRDQMSVGGFDLDAALPEDLEGAPGE
jgi:hypothetical protein